MTNKYYQRYVELAERAQKIWKKHHRSEFPYRLESRYTFDNLAPYVRKQVMDALKQLLDEWENKP